MEAELSLQLQDYNSASSSPALTTIKMEDLCQEQLVSATLKAQPSNISVLNIPDSKYDVTPSSTSKTTKKRKSWGQILPEPKTNLPPRKRAKTADEKEQRRIERVKRNRLAAHNSRERKRQEVDALQDEKHALEQRVRDMEAELASYRKLFPQANIPQAAPLAETTPFQGVSILDSYKDEYPQQDEVKLDRCTMATPSLVSFQSPSSLRSNLDSPIDTAPSTPGTELINSDPDPTQHSAAMLCDLQCRSGISSALNSTPRLHAALTTIFFYNVQISLMTTVSSTLLFSQPLATTWTAARNLSSIQASTQPTYLVTPMIIWSLLIQASSICSPAQARLLQSATQRALQRNALSVNKLQRFSESTRSVENVDRREGEGEASRRRRMERILAFNCSNTGLARDIKRSCLIISRRSQSDSGRRKRS